jgi:hypothetical protein
MLAAGYLPSFFLLLIMLTIRGYAAVHWCYRTERETTNAATNALRRQPLASEPGRFSPV